VRRILSAAAGATLLAVIAGAARADVDVNAVMRAIDVRDRGRDQVMTAAWTLVDKSGAERKRTLRSYWKDFRGDPGGGVFSKRIVVFDAPPDLSGTAFLVWSPLDRGRDDDRWVYLPALRKVRRIAGRDRGQSFFGTDFAYEDLAERTAEEDVHRFLRDETTRAGVRHVVESTPRDPAYPYAKRILWVDPASATATRIEFFDRQGRPSKTLSVDWQNAGGIWAWRRLEMVTARTGHRTVVDVTQVLHNQGLPDALFSESSLKLGVERAR
jgi:hypothetical protein